MRCAHCGHSLRYRNLFRFRADGGHRCESCRDVFYVEPAAEQKILRPINLLLVFAFIGGLMLLLRSGLMSVWLMPLYLIAFVPVSEAAHYFALAGAPTLCSLSPQILWRRRCINYGLPFLALGQWLGYVSKTLLQNDNSSHYVSFTGTAFFILFLIAGNASPPKQRSFPRSN